MPIFCRVALRLPDLQPQITAGPGATETAGAGSLNIAETFPEGRGTGGGGDWPPPVRSLRHE
ncbi:hypothetical protein NUKP68_00710 [Klebsiella variicola]|nr:hypothetical protein NUKP68_00710 [Klebsiella variicola]